MTLVAIIATAMAMQLQVQIERQKMITTQDQLYLATQIVPLWAMQTLAQSNQTILTNNKHGNVLEFPSKYAFLDANLSIEGKVEDLQARFNLNNVLHQANELLFDRLVIQNDARIDAKKLNALVKAVKRWIRPEGSQQLADPFLSIYLQHNPPYYPGYEPFNDVSEFRQVAGVDNALFEKLSPWITALPEMTPINLNTAPPTVLKALGPGLNGKELTKLLKDREAKAFKDLKAIEPLLTKFGIPPENITLSSNYFLCTAKVSSNQTTLTVYSLIYRYLDNNNQLHAKVIRESLGY